MDTNKPVDWRKLGAQLFDEHREALRLLKEYDEGKWKPKRSYVSKRKES